MRFGLSLLLFVLPCALHAQSEPLPADHAEKMAEGLKLFTKEVRGILIAKCLKCHRPERTESEFDISTRANLLKGGLAGPAVVPFAAEKSLLYRMTAHLKEPAMPFESKKLPEAQITAIRQWIDLGAPYDAPLLGKEEATAWTKKIVPPEAKQHWAYRPLGQVEPPPTSATDWVRTPIDRFIAAKLADAKLAPNASAERRVLIRRAYLTLLGVPPTPDEIDRFLADPDPQAFAKLVDRLLADPRYGERWARHWLDLVRFAESHGFEHDYDRPTAYPYRDFVIKAFNQDLPFHTFARWQLAGDEIAPQEPLAWMATGYLAAGVHSTQITKNEVEKHRYDELDDMLATTGTAFLGLTIGCARCHDHKYDAVPQRDYYRMLATFTTTIRSEIPLALDPEGDKRRQAEFAAKHQPYLDALAKFEREELPARLAAWEKAHIGRSDKVVWQIVEPQTFKSAGGATIAKQADGSLLISGKAPVIETLTVTAEITRPTPIRGIRLEALTHPSLVKGGPGRGANGNFALTDFQVSATRLDVKGAKPTPVKLIRPRADFEQKGFPISGAIDADPVSSGWAVDPQFGQDHAAAFDPAEPLDATHGLRLTLTLKFQNNVNHGLGRPRFSITEQANAALNGSALPALVESALTLAPQKRTAEQQAAVLAWFRATDPAYAELTRAEQEHAKTAPPLSTVKVLVASEGLPPIRLHSQGEDFLPTTHFLRRGDVNHKDGEATPGFLQALLPNGISESHWFTPPPAGSKVSYRRRALAEWLVDADKGAGHLVARVFVNRLWQHHFGRGLVATVSDFGVRGEAPTHPELLDWLAAEFIRSGWRVKHMQRLLMTSAVWMQASTSDGERHRIDPKNVLLSRYPTRRLEAEAIRDSILSVGGLLDATMYGPGTLDPNSKRRSIYFTMKRSKLIPMLIVFDAPDATVGIGERPATTIAPQALHLMNDPTVRAAALAFAKRCRNNPNTPAATAIDQAYRLALGRDPDATERAESLAFVTEQAAVALREKQTDPLQAALADLCQALFCLNEFAYIS